MQYCIGCGSELSADSKFCPQCGQPSALQGQQTKPKPPLQTQESDKKLGCLFWGLVVVFPPGALIWALLLDKNHPQKKLGILVPGIIFGVTFILPIMVFGVRTVSTETVEKGNSSSTNSPSSSSSTTKTEEISEATMGIGVGQILHTEYFDITVNKVGLSERVKTGNQFADLKPEQGNIYLIINASFKNTDNESRMLMDGSVWIEYNGKEYKFDKSEVVMLEGWGLLLDQINPLTIKTTNLVYKIPVEIRGPIYWQPGRADRDQRIFLGNFMDNQQ